MNYRIYYVKPEARRELGWGDVLPQLDRLFKTHVFLRSFEGLNLEHVFEYFNIGWPSEESQPLIRAKGLGHTSMSVGDVVEDANGHFWVVAPVGFTQLHDAKRQEQIGRAHV